ncbi:MAG: hypothetical protein R2874_12725 [Desulfobacterales bacterium]
MLAAKVRFNHEEQGPELGHRIEAARFGCHFFKNCLRMVIGGAVLAGFNEDAGMLQIQIGDYPETDEQFC